MAYLGDIVERMKTQLGTAVVGDYEENLKIDYIQLRAHRYGERKNSSVYNKGIIYIGGWNLHEKLPDGCCAVLFGTQTENAVMDGMLPRNVLWLDKSFEILDIYEVVQDELLSYVLFNEHKEQMFTALQGNGGIRDIIQKAYIFLENPICVCDTSFSIIENYPAHENLLDFEIRNNRQYMKPASVMSMNREGLIEKIFNDRNAFCFFRKELNMSIMYCSIRIHKNVAGYVCLLEKNRKFTHRDYEFVELLAGALSVEMQKDRFFTEKSGMKYEYFLTDMVEGNYENPDEIRQRMQQLGYKGGQYHWIMTLAFEDIYDGHISNEYYIGQLVTILDNSLATFYRGNILIFVSSDSGRVMEDGEFIKMQEFVSLNRMVMAVSYGFIRLNETPLYYEQAQELLQYGKSHGMEGQILKMEDFCLETIVYSHYRPQYRQALIHPDLRYLKDYDDKNHTEYLKTLYTYLKCGRNAIGAAKELHIHKSSFFYRFNKISELLHLDAGDCHRLFMYEMSMKIESIENM